LSIVSKDRHAYLELLLNVKLSFLESTGELTPLGPAELALLHCIETYGDETKLRSPAASTTPKNSLQTELDYSTVAGVLLNFFVVPVN
jgi:hypothetical protein